MFLYAAIISISLTTVAPQNISNNNKIYLVQKCIAVPDLFIQNRTRQLQCCQKITENLYANWYNQGAYLSRTLAT